MKTLRLTLAAALLAAPIALHAQEADRGAPAPKHYPRAETARELDAQFGRHDTDKDGFLSPAEWDKSIENDPDVEQGARVFAKMDADGDNRLTKQEIGAWMLGIFDCADENHDAELTSQELDRNGDRCLKAAGITRGRAAAADDD